MGQRRTSSAGFRARAVLDAPSGHLMPLEFEAEWVQSQVRSGVC